MLSRLFKNSRARQDVWTTASVGQAEICSMRHSDSYTENLFSSARLENFVPADHPLHPLSTWINEVRHYIYSLFL